MAHVQEATIQQSTGEIRAWTADFTDDLPTGGTVTAGTAIHTPPSGSASIPTIAFTNTTVTATLGPLAVVGVHYLDIQATYNDGQKSEVRVTFANNYPATAARSGLSDLISDVRAMANIGANDYKVAGVPYWSDAQVGRVLDRHRTDVYRERLTMVEELAAGGVPEWKVYISQYHNYEQTSGGTDVFVVEDSIGNVAGTALWTADYLRGRIDFTNSQGGTVYYLTGRSYNLEAAAADIWRQKAAHYSDTRFDFSTDNMRVNRSQLVSQALEMAKYFESSGGFTEISLERGDMVGGGWYKE